jgi:hypothetical protein
MDNQDNLMDGLRDIVHQQIKKAYMEGAHQGAINVCSIIYSTLLTAGLEETNFLFDILRDIAESHGCHNLSEEVKHIRNIQE